MSAIRNPSGRPTRVYSVQERAAIDPFKTDYMNATTPAARKIIAQTYIFPALFNHWSNTGVVIDDKEMRLRTEELLRWLRNVWRTKAKQSVIKATAYRLTDVLWWTQRDAVLAEIASIMGLKSVDTNTPGWFGHRQTAAKKILDAMSVQDMNSLRQQANLMVEQGLPVEVQRKLAEEKWYARFTRTAHERYREMGLVSISIVAYTGKSGQMVIDIHDEIASILGIPARSFEDIYEDKAKEMKRTLLEYIKTVRTASAGTGTGQTGAETSTIHLDPDGFPIAPKSIHLDKMSKNDLETLYRMYITQHYRLACRNSKRQAPFTQMSSNMSDFFHPDYLPKDINLADPRAMKMPAIKKFFQYVSERESSHGIPHAIRFKSILTSRTKGELQDAQYHDAIVSTAANADDTVANIPKTAPKPRKRNKIKDKSNSVQPKTFDMPVANPAEEPAPDTHVSWIPHNQRQRLTPQQSQEWEQQVSYDQGLITLGLLPPSIVMASSNSSIGPDTIPVPVPVPVPSFISSSLQPDHATSIDNSNKATLRPEPVIDPALENLALLPVAMSVSTRRTSDRLALEESQKYGTVGKRRPKTTS